MEESRGAGELNVAGIFRGRGSGQLNETLTLFKTPIYVHMANQGKAL